MAPENCVCKVAPYPLGAFDSIGLDRACCIMGMCSSADRAAGAPRSIRWRREQADDRFPVCEQHRTLAPGAVWHAPFPFTSIFQNGPRGQGCASPRPTPAPRGCPGAPWTAPDRSEKTTERRERGQNGKPNRSHCDQPLSESKNSSCPDAGAVVRLLCPGSGRWPVLK